MKDVPHKCPICKGHISAPDANGYIKCFGIGDGIASGPCFFAHIGTTGIDFWEAHLVLGWEEWEINSQRVFDNDDNVDRYWTEMRDRDDNLVIGLHEWFPYHTGSFLKDITKLLNRLLNLKAFL